MVNNKLIELIKSMGYIICDYNDVYMKIPISGVIEMFNSIINSIDGVLVFDTDTPFVINDKTYYLTIHNIPPLNSINRIIVF